ncbi:peptidyl-tRNA hydrolase [Fictibacillus macauensis ZFHKF-1]|uniref:Peptidyl-tRNA hydrolase n=1 Tax=Fictibacillus macauensis ZFHKF-1 TaxID=1196324 RepID=I8AFN7_9BACL|nr:peptidyl-tRNA hydrolase [Fictibacillus macauensis ZFHKF-1]
MRWFVGLGNPGKQFEKTRHNVGFFVIDELSKRFGIELNQAKFNGLYGSGMVNGEKVYLLKPLTYMNLSGESVRPFMDYFKLDVEDLAVIYDDLDMPCGKLRLRQKGSAGGHNGMKSLIQHLGTDTFNRVRFGIGRPTNRQPVPDFVLSTFAKAEEEAVASLVTKSADACEAFLEMPFNRVMNAFNG